MRHFLTPCRKHLLCLGSAFFLLNSILYAQDQDKDLSKDSKSTALSDTVPPSTSLSAPVSKQANNNIPYSIDYETNDSISINIPEHVLHLRGKSNIKYSKSNIRAAEIDVFWEKKELQARPALDTAGQVIGEPIFDKNGQLYYAKEIRYHFSNKRAWMQGLTTKNKESHVAGSIIKQTDKTSFYIKEGHYTSCNYKHPHFHFRAKKAKFREGQDILTGPFVMYLGKVPVPLGFVFGSFPHVKNKRSGVIMPRYGEENARGFFLQDGGYYFAINKYMDLSIMGSVFSNGGNNAVATWRYLRRYHFSGNLNFRYSENSASLSNNFAGRDYWLQWTHNPLSKGDQRFSISVNLGTSSYYQRNLDQAILNNIKTEFASNLNYSKTFTGTPFSTNISLRHRQNVQRKELSLSLPEISWNMQRIYPLQALFAKTKWDIRQLGISHSALLRNEISNSSRSAEPAEGLSFSDLPKLIADAKNGIQHKIPVAMPLNMMRYFVLTPSFNYTELWYGKELKHTYDAQTQEIHIDTLSQFSRAGHYAFSSGLTTRLYGLFNFGH